VVALIYVSTEIQQQAHDSKACLDAAGRVYAIVAQNMERRLAVTNRLCIRICAAFEE